MHSEGESTKFTEATSETVMLMNQISKKEKNVVVYRFKGNWKWFQHNTLL